MANNSFDELKKRSKKEKLSITVSKENLDYVKEDMIKNQVEDVPISAVFDMLLDKFVKKLKDEGDQK